VANTPGLAGSLLVGLVAAKTLCLALKIPLVTIDHLQAHIYACRLAHGPEVFPAVGLVVSGGHSNLYRCGGPLDFEWIGGTIDDAAGEAFDKVASMLGLPYPGGPAISQAAESGDPNAFAFPRPFMKNTDRFDFSFSGLKTAVRYTLCGPGRQDFSSLNLSPQKIADIAASFQEAVVDCLVTKTFLALKHYEMTNLCVGGGVAANGRLRERLSQEAERQGTRLYVAPFELCTDNAVMGAIGFEKLAAGDTAPLNADILPGQVRPAAKR
jgi:N6-L-threonylcarbamoyladenine synthase